MYRSSSIAGVFMMNNTPIDTIKHHESTKPESHQTSFSSSSSSSSSSSFTIVFAQNSSILHVISSANSAASNLDINLGLKTLD